jgi:hypothetical protein
MIVPNSLFPAIAIFNSVPTVRPSGPIELGAETEAFLISMGWAEAIETQQKVEPKPKSVGKNKAARGSTDAELP